MLSSRATVKSVLHTYWTFVCKFLIPEQKSSMQALESSHGQDHADGNVEHHGIDASQEAIVDGNVICLNSPHASHGVAQVATHSQAASQGTGVIKVQNARMTMY
jgi:hypothetical protein